MIDQFQNSGHSRRMAATTEALFTSEKFLVFGIGAFLFLFNNYCSIID